MGPHILFLIVTLVLPKLAKAEGNCFFPDGSTSDKDVPCFINDSSSRCCSPNEFCSTNKLCIRKDDTNRFARGSCLDKGYGATCPTFCKGVNDKKHVEVFACGDPSLGQFCCDDGEGDFSCCGSRSNIITLGTGTPFNESPVESTTIAMNSMSRSPTRTLTSAATSVRTVTTMKVATSFQEISAQPQTSIIQTTSQVLSPIQLTSFPVFSSIQVQPSSTSPSIPPTLLPILLSTAAASPTLVPTQPSIFQTPPLLFSSTFTPPAIPILQSSSIAPELSTRILSSTELIPSSQVSSLSTAVPVPIASTSTPANSVPTAFSTNITTVSSDSSDSVSTATIASALVGGVIALTCLIILFVFLLRRRAAKRLSKSFEASLGRTNFADEKGPLRSGKSFGFGLGKIWTGGSERTARNISVPVVDRPTPNVARIPEPGLERPAARAGAGGSTFDKLLADVKSQPF